MQEHVEKPLHEMAYVFIGDAANNMGDSLLIGGAKMGMDVRLCAPEECWPEEAIQDEAQAIARETGARITITDDIDTAVAGVDFVYTDVWVRSEEHTSELQSRPHLVCRLLLEKKKKQ